jgi:aminoacrylate peracid reductase
VAGTVIYPDGAPRHGLPLSPGMRAGDTIYVSGTVAVDEEGRMVGVGDIETQTRCVIEAAGASLADVVYNQVFLADLADFRGMNKTYAEYFPDQPPARYCIQAPLVREEFLVEIAAIAYVGD